MHGFTITRRWERFLDPVAPSDGGFPVNRNPVIDLAALVRLIRRDHFSLGGRLARRVRPALGCPSDDAREGERHD